MVFERSAVFRQEYAAVAIVEQRIEQGEPKPSFAPGHAVGEGRADLARFGVQPCQVGSPAQIRIGCLDPLKPKIEI
jgi:hypothetical protein